MLCKYCPYTTTRSYNMKRHYLHVHNEEPPSAEEPTTELKEDYCECPKCSKVILKKNLSRHQETCKEMEYSQECDVCHRRFANEKTLKQHQPNCSKESVIAPSTSVDNHGSIHTQNNNIHNTTNVDNSVHNHNYTLVFPETTAASSVFDFITDHIQDKAIKKCIVGNPEDGFSKFMWKVFQNPLNRIVKKNSLKSKYCKIYIGKGRWATRLDQKVLPEVAHHMTTAAIARVTKAEEQPWYTRIRFAAETFLYHVREINQSAPEDIKTVLDHIRCHLQTLADYDKQGVDAADSD